MTSDASSKGLRREPEPGPGETPGTGHGPHRLTRRRDGRLLAGVCAGLARSIGVDPFVVRVAVVVLTIAGGTGAVAYLAAWMLLPEEGKERSLAQSVVRNRRWDPAQVLAGGSVLLGVLLIVRNTGIWFGDAIIWPVLLAAVGLAVIWRQAGDDERPSPMRVPVELRSRRAGLARVIAGVGLVVAGVAAFLAASDAFSALRQGLVATTVIVAGLALISGPWWLRLGRDLARERRERIRSEERAEVATHLHDSVLQTLALIQRNAGEPRTVVTMARRQERELRGWLWESGREPPGGDTLAAEVIRAAEEVEESHGVSMEVVTVGDCALDDRLRAMVAASREAMVNAATWSGATTVSVFSEVKGTDAAVFVRDWGTGFDPDTVSPDRHGVRESICGRMTRHGGTAVVRSTVGEGTEVQLRMSVAAG